MKKILFLALGSLVLSSAALAANDLTIVSKQGKFEDVRDDLVMAVEGRGLKINHTNHISDMLDRTGAAVGDTRQVYVKAEQVEFCKADLSRDIMEADPANIVFCPYTISIYTRPSEPGRVYLAYRKPVAFDDNPASNKALGEIDAMMKGILDDAVKGAF